MLHWHVKARVAHQKRLADPLLNNDVQRFASDDFEDTAEHIQAKTVIPEMPWLSLEWHLRQEVAPVLQIVDGACLRLLKEFLINLVIRALGRWPWVAQCG